MTELCLWPLIALPVSSLSPPPPQKNTTTRTSSALWVRDSYWLRLALSLEAQYQFAGLRHSAEKLDYKDWQVPLGRRFRALKLWFVLRMYGAASIRAYLRHRWEVRRWEGGRGGIRGGVGVVADAA